MADRVSSFVIGFDGDAGDLNSVLSAIKTSVRSAVSDIQAASNKVNLFGKLEEDVNAAGAAFQAAKLKVADLAAEISNLQLAGGSIGADLTKQLKLAETAALSAQKAYASQVATLGALATKLEVAGIDTNNLAASQIKLAESLKIATAAAAEQSAKSLLGFKSLGDVQPQILALQKAFDTLRASGKLSATEIAAAQGLLQEKIAAVKAEVTGLGTAIETQGGSFTSVLTNAQAKFLGFAAAVGTVVGAVRDVTHEANAFNLAITQIGTISDASQTQLDDLAEGARKLARTMGFDVVDAVHALYDVVRSGISPENSLTVLEASAEAAKASLTDIGTTAKLSATLVKAFGVNVDDLSKTLDILFQGTKDGGPTLAELSAGLGSLAPVAKATNVPIEELTAALQVLVKAGVDAPTAITDLNRVLTKLDTTAVRDKLRALGIEVNGLLGTLQQLGTRGLALDQLVDLGLASTKSATAIAGLTNNTKGLAEEMARLKDSAGATAKAVALLEETPQERLEKFSAAVKDLEINLGNAIGTSSKLAVVFANLINLFNNLSPSVRSAVAQTSAFGVASSAAAGGFGLFSAAISNLNLALALLTSRQSSATAELANLTKAAQASTTALQNAVAGIAAAVDASLAAVTQRINDARGRLQGFTADIDKLIAQSQAATSAALADLKTRADAQIAALDQTAAAEKATAEATLAIQTKLAADRLALVVKSNADVLKAFDADAAARVAIAKRSGEDLKKVDLEIAQARLAILAGQKGQLEAQFRDALSAEKTFVDELNSIDKSRVAFNNQVEKDLRDIRNEGLSGFDAYIEKVRQINELLAKAQQQFELGGKDGLALGKTYTDDAIALSKTLATVIDASGTQVVSALDVQYEKTQLITKAAKQRNEAEAAQAQAAKDGRDASIEAADAIIPRLQAVRQEYDTLAAKVAEGLALKLNADKDGIDKALKEIDDALAAKAHILEVKVDVETAIAQIAFLVDNLKKGITEGADAQLSAISDSLKRIVAEAPELTLKTDAAFAELGKVSAAIEKINEIRPTLTVDSNVAEVQKAIDKLKEPTESTHTIHIVTDGGLPGGDTTAPSTTPTFPGFARGGLVGGIGKAQQAWRKFAAGGPVFPTAPWTKVPGVGNLDTVPAGIESGAFVLRKAAANFYGDVALGALAGRAALRRFASGGRQDLGQGLFRDTSTPFFGDVQAGTPSSVRDAGEIDAPTLPSDPKAKADLVINYVYAVAEAAVQDDYFYWRQNLKLMNDAKNTYDFAPTDAHLERMLQYARTIGLNLGIKKNTHTGFDVDGRRWHKQLATNLPAGLFGALVYEYDFFAKGGQAGAGTDTVNALLTPGEAVISKPAAERVGYDFLERLNQMKIPRAEVEAFARPELPARPARFAEGGIVTDQGNVGFAGVGASWQKGGQWQGGAGGNMTVNINGAGLGDVFSVENLRRYFMPSYNTILRRGQ